MAGGVLVCERGECIRLSEQAKTNAHDEGVGRRLGKPPVEVSGSSEIIHLDKQTKTPKHYEVVWRRLGTPPAEVSGSPQVIQFWALLFSKK